MADETLIIDTWLAAILKGDTGAGGVATLSTGGIHNEIDPSSNAVYPKTIFRYQGGRYIQTVNGIIVALSAVYAIYGVVQEPSYAGLKSLAARYRALLHRQMGTTADGLILASVQIEPLKFGTVEEGIHKRMLGGLYRIYSQSA